MPDYELVSQPRKDKKGGGTAVYINKSFTFQVKKEKCLLTKNNECLCIELTNTNGKNIFVACVYRPPDGNISSFEKSLIKVIFNANKEKKNVFIAGDFNIDALKYNKFKSTKQFFDTMFEKGLFPCIHKPTRITKKSQTIIDNIFSNILNNDFECGIFKTDISDHFPNFLIVRDIRSINSERSIKRSIYKRDLSKQKIESFRKALEETSWNDVTIFNQNTNAAYDIFSEKIQDTFDTFCPIKEVKLKPKEILNPWMTNGLKKSSKRKQKLYNKFLKSRSIKDENNYKTYKAFYQKLIKTAKKTYYSNQLIKYIKQT